ncbi:RNI-like protein [Xylariaceae sp. FL0255]|nr:RNI-like protein [Xylariaceae sp. FL0255]
MEQVLDVSWMTHAKDKLGHSHHSNSPPSSSNLGANDSGKVNGKTTTSAASTTTSAPMSSPGATPTQTPTAPKSTPQRPGGRSRSASTDSNNSVSAGTPPQPPQRRPSWFSNISSKFSGSPTPSVQSQVADPVITDEPNASIDDDVAPLPKITPNRNAVLPHATRQTGDAPYTPAPPRSAQQGFLGVFRRLSSSNGVITAGTRASHGLVDRKVLNVDRNRDRCVVNELSQAKLRRVAFCVDVEIAPMPKYTDEEPLCKKTSAEKNEKKKALDKSEGLTLKEPKPIDEAKEQNGNTKAPTKPAPADSKLKENGNTTNSQREKVNTDATATDPRTDKGTTRKKEKKKKSEAERKAKKEQKRKEALEKGAIPMEIHLDSDTSTDDTSIRTRPRAKSQITPTTNPARIYRRCCQLRETDILTKITSQLPKSTEKCSDGIVEKLDLTGYLLPLPDLVTLSDFLAVVPVKEVLLENCGLTDEGLRVVLAGLLAAQKPSGKHRKVGPKSNGSSPQGGVVERLVLKNNKIGIEGWKHICLFIHMCRSIKFLDISHLSLPPMVEPAKTSQSHHTHNHNGHPGPHTLDVALLLAKSLENRLAGRELELLNLGGMGLSGPQLGFVIDAVIKSGVIRLGLSHNNIDAQGVQHVVRYLRNLTCEGLDLGGNDLRNHLETIAAAIEGNNQLWALSIANCNLNPTSLSKLLPTLCRLSNLKFIDLSHNRALFESESNAITPLRRYLPKLEHLRRLHLADVSLSAEQVIALAEILPENKSLAHINLLENPELVRLADARTEDMQEESCALYASLLAAVRISKTLVKIDIDDPTPESGELLKAIANRVVAYTMRNLQGDPNIRGAAEDLAPKLEKYPDVLRHLVGHEEDFPIVDENDGSDVAPDEDYVVGGTAVAKALACVLKNRGDDSRRQSGDFAQEMNDGVSTPRKHLSHAKANDVSKHLLAVARKIRVRLQPALASAKALAREDQGNYHRLIFLDQTIEGIIKRFEDEFPDTRQTEEVPSGETTDRIPLSAEKLGSSPGTHDIDNSALSDTEDFETTVRPSLSRSNSIISHTSKAFSEEEGRALRVGHRFRRSFMSAEQFNILNSDEEIGSDPRHILLVTSVMEDIMEENEDIRKRVEEVGAVRAFEEDKDTVWRLLKDKDPDYWTTFLESQEKARANIKVETNGNGPAKIDPARAHAQENENAIDDNEETNAD